MTTDLVKAVEKLEKAKVPIAYIPDDGSTYVQGRGYRVAIVFAGDDAFHLTGDWPYTGAADQKMPWFWGPPSRTPRKPRRSTTRSEAYPLQKRPASSAAR